MTIETWLKDTRRSPYIEGLALLAQNGGSAAMLARLQHETAANRQLLALELRKAARTKLPKVTKIEDAPANRSFAPAVVTKKKRRASGGCCN